MTIAFQLIDFGKRRVDLSGAGRLEVLIVRAVWDIVATQLPVRMLRKRFLKLLDAGRMATCMTLDFSSNLLIAFDCNCIRPIAVHELRQYFATRVKKN